MKPKFENFDFLRNCQALKPQPAWKWFAPQINYNGQLRGVLSLPPGRPGRNSKYCLISAAHAGLEQPVPQHAAGASGNGTIIFGTIIALYRSANGI